ncbi:glycosyltransferase family 2 protein [Microvirga pudoricolor]|uniref:glycosyltransferase family 2 protein n=1 Tax=Microvirga pudoricolor TaxID=2778729 RepID=UPI00194F7776|nr:glycosyltransferase family 2 protein [Microvirga pudoricolor]MBM6593020.1 glycosyltransferase family 2 protein [Microvirga pudoricolor]
MESIAVIIPTFNRRSCLVSLLIQLEAQHPIDAHLSVVVVVDGSTDGTAEILASRFPNVHCVMGDGDWWFTRCANRGIQYAEAAFDPDAFLILNDDSQIEKDYLLKLISSVRSLGEPALVGSMSLADTEPPRVTFSGNAHLARWRLKLTSYLPHFCVFDPQAMTGLHPTYGLVGRGMFIPKEVVRDVGYMDEITFPQYGSDDDYALTALQRGFPVYVSWDAWVATSEKLTSEGTAHRQQTFRVFLRSFFNRHSVNSLKKHIAFYRRHGIAPLWPLAVALFIAGTCRAYFWKYRHLSV